MIPKTVSRGLLLTPLLAALAGCNTVVMSPSGDIAKQQAHLIAVSVISTAQAATTTRPSDFVFSSAS